MNKHITLSSLILFLLTAPAVAGERAPLLWYDGSVPRKLWPPTKARATAKQGVKQPSSPAMEFRDERGRPYLLTPYLVIRFEQAREPGEARRWGAAEGLILIRRLSQAAYLYHCALDEGCITLSAELYHYPEVRYAYPDFIRSRTLRDAPFRPDDPLFPAQWYLDNTGQSGGVPGADIHVLPAWDRVTGLGSTIGIVDDGMETDHEDLVENIVPELGWDFVDDDDDPNGGSHGTKTAGIAAAAGGNGAGIAGTAPDASLAGLRLDGAYSDSNEASALSHRRDRIDIYSSSWGPNDGGAALEAPGPLTQEALAEGAASGRNGLGSIFIWAGGNGGLEDNANYDGYANSRFTISVAAATDLGTRASYSEPGACHLIAAPSSGGVSSVTTTTSGNDYTSRFGGTSAAAPMVAGVVALMLEANPGLGWRDVQQILALTAVRIAPDHPDWRLNGAGHWVNHDFGFGGVDAGAAVQVARHWTPAPTEVSASASGEPQQIIPDADPDGIVLALEITRDLRIESVDVTVDASDHPQWGDLSFVLISPAGTRSVLAEFHDNGAGYDYFNWRFNSMRLLDERALGTWKLQVRDHKAGNQGTLKSWKLVVHGTDAAVSSCSGDPLVLDADFIARVAFCTSSLSVRAGSGVLLHSIVTLESPVVILQTGFRVESGSHFHVRRRSPSLLRQ